MSGVFGRLLLSLAGKNLRLPSYTYHCQQRSFHFCSVLFGEIVQFNLSDIGEGIAEVQIKEWFVKPGDKINEFDAICDVQSDKASVTITSRFAGTVQKLYYNIDDIAHVGKPLVDIELAGDEEEGEASKQVSEEIVPEPSPASEQVETAGEERDAAEAAGKVLAAPAVRRIAKEHQIDLTEVSGSGKDGRVLKEDVLKHIGLRAEDVEKPPTQEWKPDLGEAALRPLVIATAEDKVLPIRGYSRIMVKTMTEANKIPHFGYCDEVNVNKLVDLRDQLKPIAERKRIKMTFMPLFVKAASLALHQFPVLNASLDPSLENVIYKAAHNICCAMDTPHGLVVPNIKHCEQKNLWEIAAELSRLHQAAMKAQLSQEDLAEGTFTLSNIGPIGGTYVHPVIFPPQVAIGALGQIKVIPRYNENGTVEPVHTVKISWSADHRIVDGATMARFSNVWKHYLEYPAMMIAEMK